MNNSPYSSNATNAAAQNNIHSLQPPSLLLLMPHCQFSTDSSDSSDADEMMMVDTPKHHLQSCNVIETPYQARIRRRQAEC